MNVPFAVLAIRRRGWMFTVRTAICIAVVSAFSALHPVVFRIEHIDPLRHARRQSAVRHRAADPVPTQRKSGRFQHHRPRPAGRHGVQAGWTMMILDSIVVLCGLFQIAPITVLQSALGVVLLNLVLALNHRPGRYIGR